MNDKKDQYVTLFQAGMLILNILAVGLICGFIYATTNRILAHYDARTFLDSVVTIPVNPGENLLLCMGLMMVMVITFALRQIWQQAIRDMRKRTDFRIHRRWTIILPNI